MLKITMTIPVKVAFLSESNWHTFNPTYAL
jgi:hypothetical protein